VSTRSPNNQSVRTRLTKQANYECLTHQTNKQTNKPIVSIILTHPTTKLIESNKTKSRQLEEPKRTKPNEPRQVEPKQP